MERYEHLKLPLYKGDVERFKRGGGGFKLPKGRNKNQFSQQARQNARSLSGTFAAAKKRLSGEIDLSLIFEIKINQGVYPESFEKELTKMDIHVLSIAEGKKGYWIVFSEDEELEKFKKKLEIYGSEEGRKYNFFNAIESFRDIPVEAKIGKRLVDQPLTETQEFIDLELWKRDDQRKNKHFIEQLKQNYSNFRITDTLITKTFVLLRVKLTKSVFDEVIQLKEIARADRPAIVEFNPFEFMRPDVSNIEFSAPKEDAAGILVIDSGIISNHPMLANCVGSEENYQSGERETQDTVGHGTGVAGCAIYGDIEECLEKKEFRPSNWLFSAKVMYAETDLKGQVTATYDPEQLVEHQLQTAVEDFLSSPEYHIKIVNISLGNLNEVWHKDYSRQLPLAALIDEMAFKFPHVVFVVSAGNQSPFYPIFDTIADIKENYPRYLIEDENFKIINPASAALALTVGSIAGDLRIENERYGAEEIKTPIAPPHQPSPFTRTGEGINGMIKPELVEYGGNLILSDGMRGIIEDKGGKLVVLNNQVTENIIHSTFAVRQVT